MTFRLRRLTAALLLVLMALGCSRAVLIPREDVTKPEYREPGSYRIRLQGWEEYLALRFSVTDSTVVITELLPADQRYRRGRSELPISITLSEVASISEFKPNWLTTSVWILSIAAVAAMIVIVATVDFPQD